jgi:hypothetical protein
MLLYKNKIPKKNQNKHHMEQPGIDILERKKAECGMYVNAQKASRFLRACGVFGTMRTKKLASASVNLMMQIVCFVISEDLIEA